jgi:hypothetical protein
VPRPNVSAAYAAALAASYGRPAFFVELHFVTGPMYVWSGYGSKSWNGHTWLGVGSFGGVSVIEEGSTLKARGISLTLSGIDTAVLQDVLEDYRQGLPVLVYLGMFDGAGVLIPDPVCSWAGLTDQPTISVSGEQAVIEVAAESELVSWNVSVERRYTNEDQQLDFPGDRGLEYVNSIQEITIFWGRHPAAQNNLSSQGHAE